MLKYGVRLLAEASGAASTTAKTTAAGGRLIRVRKKAKWIDRRSTRVPHNGKDVFNFGDQPSCALCHVRFRYKQDYEMHKESELHKNRTRWVETVTWWNEVGAPAHRRQEQALWEWYEEHALPDRAKELSCSVEEAKNFWRRAVMPETPSCHLPLQCPSVRGPIREPRDQRWPASPKW